jgi:hypothetical protein
VKLRLLMFAALLLAAVPTVAQSISVPVDTSKATQQVPVQTTFKAADGVWWQVSGTLTLKPIPAPTSTGELPPPVPTPNPTPNTRGPAIVGVHNDGQILLLTGHDFGAEKGTLWLVSEAFPVTNWTDKTVTADVSARATNPMARNISVRTAEGQWATSYSWYWTHPEAFAADFGLPVAERFNVTDQMEQEACARTERGRQDEQTRLEGDAQSFAAFMKSLHEPSVQRGLSRRVVVPRVKR